MNLQQRELELLLQDIETSVELCRDLRNQLQKEASQRRSALCGKAVEFKAPKSFRSTLSHSFTMFYMVLLAL